ncbi:MAG: DUF3105 domain-containing protein [Actinomycetota bacterium]|nr:DUF3105 domain-containing protein [Actinomycetota bacterium]
MTSRREEKERLRAERLAAEAQRASSEKRRLYLGYVVAGLLTIAVLGGFVAVLAGGSGDGSAAADTPENCHIAHDYGSFEDWRCDEREGTAPPEIQFGDLEDSAQRASCELKLDLPEEGNNHFQDENQGTYETNPPTSGDHFGAPDDQASGALADGAYIEPPPESRLVHSMEHGRVEIRYAPTLPKNQQLALKGVFDDDPGGVILVPDPDLPYAVAVSSWQNYVGCAKYDPLVLDVVRNFRDRFRGNGPENIPF